MSLRDDIRSDLNTIFFNPDELAEVHSFTTQGSSGLITFSAACNFDQDELMNLKQTYTNDAALNKATVLVLINECWFPNRPRYRQDLTIDTQKYMVQSCYWELGLLKIALTVGAS